MSLRPGDVIEHFVIVSPLGEGGMGQVYVARDQRLQRSVALKIMQVETTEAGGAASQPSAGAARLLREAQSAAALEHPNVVTIYEVGEIKGGEADGHPFIAMELVKGKTLRALIADSRAPMRERIRWLVDMARGLSVAHKAGLVHRDIKPENVMVRDDGVVKVLDFGLAKRAAGPSPSISSSTEAQVLPSLTAKGVAIGTPYYMAPEQMRREPLDGRADQFAWGVVAYELLSGVPPWGREVDALELVSKLLSEDPTPLAQVNAEVPAHVAAAVERAMSKKKGARFETMDALIAAIEDASGAFAPTLPKIEASKPSLPDVESEPAIDARSKKAEPAPAAKTTVSIAPPPRRGRALAVAAVVLALASVSFLVARKYATPAAQPAAVAAKPAAECTHNAECVTKLGGKPAVCNPSGRCVAIENEDCKASYDRQDVETDETIWIGGLFPMTGSSSDWGQADANTLELSRREFGTVGGVPGKAQGERRGLALILCDAAKDSRRSAAHLVDLGVPVVIGFGTNLRDTIDLASTVFIPEHTLMLDVIHDSPLITGIPQPPGLPRLVWRLSASAPQTGAALAHLVSDYVEPSLRSAAHGLSSAEPTKLAVVRSDGNHAAAMVDAASSAMRINGRSLVDNVGTFRQFTYGTKDDETALVAELVGFAPDIVVYADGWVFEQRFLEQVERTWRGARRPVYISSGILGDEAIRIVGSNRELRHRMLSVELPANTDENLKFVLHYNELFEPKISPGTAPGVVYDAFYVAAFAAAGVSERRVTGLDVAEGMKRLSGEGLRVGVGPSSIFAGYDVLQRTGALHLTGAGTQLDLDPQAGELSSDFAVYCLGVDAKGRAAPPVESGLRFDHRAKRLTGSMSCP